MRCIDLFAGGCNGFGLAAKWMGWQTVACVEIDKFNQQLLKQNFPEAEIYGDIREFNKGEAAKYRGSIDLITGGDPCQPSSKAGMGKGQEDDRYLWPSMFESIQAICPAIIVNENVDGTISNGILDIKITNLESEGYTCEPISLPVDSVGGMHFRERVWLIAYNTDKINQYRASKNIPTKEQEIQERNHIPVFGEPVDLWSYCSDTDQKRWRKQQHSTEPTILQEGISRYFGFGPDRIGDIPGDVLESAIVGMLNGLPEGMDFTARTKRIEACGNAVSPVLVYEIYKAIETTFLK